MPRPCRPRRQPSGRPQASRKRPRLRCRPSSSSAKAVPRRSSRAPSSPRRCAMRATPSWPRRWRRTTSSCFKAHLRALRLQRGAAALRGPRCGGRWPEVREQRHLLSVHPGHGPDHGSGHVRVTTPTSWRCSSRRPAAAAVPRTTSRLSARRSSRWACRISRSSPSASRTWRSQPWLPSRRPCSTRRFPPLQHGDLLMMCLYRTRPYEVEPGSERPVRPLMVAECKRQLARGGSAASSSARSSRSSRTLTRCLCRAREPPRVGGSVRSW